MVGDPGRSFAFVALETPGEKMCRFAARYLELGFDVIPLAPGSKVAYPGLLPVVDGKPSWRPLVGNAHASAATVSRLPANPGINIGIFVGQGRVVADIDRHVPLPLLREFLRLGAPVVATKRGVHVYLSGSSPTRSTAFGHIRGAGSYVVAPPSIHESGTEYTWLQRPATCPPPPVDDFLAVMERQGHILAPEASPTEGQSVVNGSAAGGSVVNMGSLLPHSVPSSWHAGLDGLGLDDLAEWDSRKFFVDAFVTLLGIPCSEIGRSFCCVLPGHEERHPSASLWPDAKGRVVYHDWHAQGTMLEYLTLAEVYAASVTRVVRKLPGPTLGCWKVRLLIALGFIQPTAVRLPSLPSNPSPAERKVHDGLKLLVQCRWLRNPGQPVPFGHHFAAEWCGLSERHAGLAIQRLMEHGVIQRVPTPPGGGRVNFYLPGELA